MTNYFGIGTYAQRERYDSLRSEIVFRVSDLNDALRLLMEKRIDIEMNGDDDGGTWTLKSAFRYLRTQRDLLKGVLNEY